MEPLAARDFPVLTRQRLASGVEKPYRQLVKEVIAVVRQHVGPVASFKDAIVVKRLPKTRSGKIARGTIAALIAGKQYKVRTSIFSQDSRWKDAIQQGTFRSHHESNNFTCHLDLCLS